MEDYLKSHSNNSELVAAHYSKTFKHLFKCNCRKFACCVPAIAATPIAPVNNCSNALKLSVSDPEKGVTLICACAILLSTRLDYVFIVQSVLFCLRQKKLNE